MSTRYVDGLVLSTKANAFMAKAERLNSKAPAKNGLKTKFDH